MKLNTVKAAKGFSYYAGPQRVKEWFDLRNGKITASRLGDWMAKSKAAGKNFGTPLKARYNYEAEILYEREFGVSFDKYMTDAMQDGVDFERFAIEQYEKITGNKVEECGAFYNELFCASPDGLVGDDGLVEVKVLKDSNFMDVLLNGVKEDHALQIQGCLMASGRKWSDNIIVNLNTKKIKVLRVKEYDVRQAEIAAAIKEPFLTKNEMQLDDVYDFQEVSAEQVETMVDATKYKDIFG